MYLINKKLQKILDTKLTITNSGFVDSGKHAMKILYIVFYRPYRFKIRLQFNSRWWQSESKPTEKGTEAKEKENDR